jgi:hypothetical protein
MFGIECSVLSLDNASFCRKNDFLHHVVRELIQCISPVMSELDGFSSGLARSHCHLC